MCLCMCACVLCVFNCVRVYVCTSACVAMCDALEIALWTCGLLSAMFDTSEAVVWQWCLHTRNVWFIPKDGVIVMSFIRARFNVFQIAVWPSCMHTRNLWCIRNCAVNVCSSYTQRSTYRKRRCDRDVVIRAMLHAYQKRVWPWWVYTCKVWLQMVVWPSCRHTRTVWCIGNGVVNVWRSYDQCSAHWERQCDRDVLIRVTFDAYEKPERPWWGHKRKVWSIPNCGVTVMYAYA